MVEVSIVVHEDQPERRHRPHRRHRWRHVQPADLKRWREVAQMTREQVAEILQVHPSTISGWERNEWAPPPRTQRRLRSLVGSRQLHAPAPRVAPPVQPPRIPDEGAAPRGDQPRPGYDESRGREEAEDVVMSAPTVVTGEEELGIKRRVTTLMTQVSAGELRLPTVERDCRWGIHDGIAVIKSKRTDGMVYFFEQVTGAFYRTHAPDSTRLQGDTPRSVIEQDRAWLYPLFNSIPGGNNVIRRYHRQNVQAPAQAGPNPAPAREENPVTVATPQLRNDQDRLLDLNVVERKKVTMVLSTKSIELGPHQIHALLRRAGAKLPDAAEIRGGPAGFSVEWSLAKDRVAGRYFDSESVGKESISVSVPQLAGMFTLLGYNLGEKPSVAFTPQGYVRIEWTESKEEVQEAA